jgi:hypothetical protein
MRRMLRGVGRIERPYLTIRIELFPGALKLCDVSVSGSLESLGSLESSGSLGSLESSGSLESLESLGGPEVLAQPWLETMNPRG